MSSSIAEHITAARPCEGFSSLEDFVQRTNISRPNLALLADADAFQSIELNRREALWNALAAETRPVQKTLFQTMMPDCEPAAYLPAMQLEEEVHADYNTTGLTLRPHPMSFQRAWLRERGVIEARQLATVTDKKRVRVAGLVLMRQRPATASGITFVTLEDETGIANLIIHLRTWERYRQIAQHSQAWIARGRVESQDSVTHLIVQHIEDISSRLATLHTSSRDFH